jgi:DNA-binding CsgD family transcriptional regulator
MTRPPSLGAAPSPRTATTHMTPSPSREGRGARRGEPLTNREVQILSLVAAGEPTAAISRRLGISENTVKSHLTNIYAKTGCLNRVQAARYYLREYTTDHQPAPQPTGGDALIDQQIREIQIRLSQLSPAASELERLQHALDALRALKHL